MNWQELCDSPAFKDLPFKVETNRWGNIEMSPASNEHGLYQVLIRVADPPCATGQTLGGMQHPNQPRR